VQPAEYRSYDALGLAGLVAAKAVTPDELLDVALGLIQAADPRLNSVVNVFESQARQAIDDGLPPGPFGGVPFAIKDLWTNVNGVVTSNGSRLFADAVATHDSEVVRRYRQAGLVIFAKTNSPELGTSPTTEPALFGPTGNPWDLTFSSGGSSGGAAATVAAGILPLAHATDGGGSIRIPAACCGLFGLKPTRGRVSSGPERGEGWSGMSAQHVVSRSVRDSAAALDVAAGAMAGDPYWAPPQCPSYLAEVATAPGRLRVGLIVDAPTGVTIDPVCQAAAQSTARRLEALGHDVIAVRWPFPAEQHAAVQSIIPAQLAATVDARLARLGRTMRPDDLEAVTAALIERGRAMSAIDYVNAVGAMHQIGRAMGGLFEDIDVLVTPTLGRGPFSLGTLSGSDVARFVSEVGSVACFTAVANITGQPAMSLPLDQAPGGMPVGSQVIGRFGDEATLFRLAGQLETAHGWFERIPPGPTP
jgi:amidase